MMTASTPRPRPATFVEARLFWRPALWLLGASAITMPWRRIYVVAERFDDPVLRRHEMIHIEQIDRDGVIVFCVRYLWWGVRHGYWNNPYEVEAYARENEPPGHPGRELERLTLIRDKRSGRTR